MIEPQPMIGYNLNFRIEKIKLIRLDSMSHIRLVKYWPKKHQTNLARYYLLFYLVYFYKIYIKLT